MLLEARLLDERREGRAEGRIEGKAEGRVEGKAEGRVEEKLATAKRLLSMGLTIQDIAKATALSVEQIEEIMTKQA